MLRTASNQRYASTEELGAKDLFRYRQGLDKAIPPRGGDKDFLPDGSWLQEKKLESFNSERQHVLSEPRVQREGDLVKGEWNPERRLVEFKKEMKNFWEHMGFIDSARKWLYPEEALFLMETSILEVWYKGLPLSISEGYMMFLDKVVSLEYYQVFAHLRRIGYVVVRHQGRLKTTKYEQQIGLNTALSRKERKLLQRKQKLEMKSKKQTAGEDKPTMLGSIDDIETTENKGVVAEEMEVDADLDNDISNKVCAADGNMIARNLEKGTCKMDVLNLSTSENILKRKLTEASIADTDGVSYEEITEFNPADPKLSMEQSEVTVANSDDFSDMTEETLELYRDKANMEDTDVSTTQGISENMTREIRTDNHGNRPKPIIPECLLLTHDKSCSNQRRPFVLAGKSYDTTALDSDNEIDKTKSGCTESCRWNFEEIVFPDFGCTEPVIVVGQPNRDQTPGTFETKCKHYEFERTQCINKKKEKRKNRREEIERTDNLKFSNPSMNEEMAKSIQSCTNWKEYKLEKTRRRSLWNRKKAFPHLFGEVESLVKPELATSTSDVLEQLHCIKEVWTKSTGLVSTGNHDKPVILPNFDVYKPDVRFRKSSPGVPDHRVVVARCSDPMPELSTVFTINSYLGDDVPLNWAVVESGNIAFYTISDFTLPLDISVG